ncbi:MAG: DUF1549 domain-containing protein, partial [Planctomycetia bacterium]
MRILSAAIVLAAALACEPRAAEPVSSEPRRGRIDELLAASAKSLDLAPTPLIDDTAYLRRATIDLVGRIPTVAEHGRYFSE